MLAGNAFKHSRQVLVCPFLVCFLLCLVRSHRTNRTCMSSCISWHHSCWAETTKSPKTTQILQQVGKTTNLEYQGISYESGLKQQPLLSAVLINYSWFVSQSWAQLTHPPNVSVCWPNLPIPCSFLTAKERISSSHFAQLSSARGRWEKGWRESWKAECCPRDAALLLGAQQRHSR